MRHLCCFQQFVRCGGMLLQGFNGRTYASVQKPHTSVELMYTKVLYRVKAGGFSDFFQLFSRKAVLM